MPTGSALSDPLSIEVEDLLARTDTLLGSGGRALSENGQGFLASNRVPLPTMRSRLTLGRHSSIRSSNGGPIGPTTSPLKKTASFKHPLAVDIPIHGEVEFETPTPRLGESPASRPAASVAFTDPLTAVLERSASVMAGSPSPGGGGINGGRIYSSFAGLQDMVSMMDDLVGPGPVSPARSALGAGASPGLGGAGRFGAGLGSSASVLGGGPGMGVRGTRSVSTPLGSEPRFSPGVGSTLGGRPGTGAGSRMASPALSPRSPLQRGGGAPAVPAASPSSKVPRRQQLAQLLGKDFAAPYDVTKLKTELASQAAAPSSVTGLSNSLTEKFDRMKRKLKNFELVEEAAREKFSAAMDSALEDIFARVHLSLPSDGAAASTSLRGPVAAPRASSRVVGAGKGGAGSRASSRRGSGKGEAREDEEEEDAKDESGEDEEEEQEEQVKRRAAVKSKGGAKEKGGADAAGHRNGSGSSRDKAHTNAHNGRNGHAARRSGATSSSSSASDSDEREQSSSSTARHNTSDSTESGRHCHSHKHSDARRERSHSRSRGKRASGSSRRRSEAEADPAAKGTWAEDIAAANRAAGRHGVGEGAGLAAPAPAPSAPPAYEVPAALLRPFLGAGPSLSHLLSAPSYGTMAGPGSPHSPGPAAQQAYDHQPQQHPGPAGPGHAPGYGGSNGYGPAPGAYSYPPSPGPEPGAGAYGGAYAFSQPPSQHKAPPPAQQQRWMPLGAAPPPQQQQQGYPQGFQHSQPHGLPQGYQQGYPPAPASAGAGSAAGGAWSGSQSWAGPSDPRLATQHPHHASSQGYAASATAPYGDASGSAYGSASAPYAAGVYRNGSIHPPPPPSVSASGYADSAMPSPPPGGRHPSWHGGFSPQSPTVHQYGSAPQYGGVPSYGSAPQSMIGGGVATVGLQMSRPLTTSGSGAVAGPGPGPAAKYPSSYSDHLRYAAQGRPPLG